MKRIILTVSSLIMALTLAAQTPAADRYKSDAALTKFETARAMTDKKQYDKREALYREIVPRLEQLSAQGSGYASYAMGQIAESNPTTFTTGMSALKYYKLSLEQGYGRAAVDIARHTDNLKKNVKYFIQGAELGDAEACTLLAHEYYYGFRIKQDKQKALQLLEKAEGDETSRYKNILYPLMGNLYKESDNIPRAIYAFEKAYDYGYYISNFEISRFYLNGATGVKRDYKKAVEYMRLSIADGVSISVRDLAECYRKGLGVTLSNSKAERLEKVSAEIDAMPEDADVKKYVRETIPEFLVPDIDPANPPVLQIVRGSLQFIDESGNNAVEAGEKCYIRFKVQNVGRGDGYGCIARAQSDDSNIKVSEVRLPVLKGGSTTDVEMPVEALAAVGGGNAEFSVSVWEPNGMGSKTILLTVDKRSSDTPLLQITDYDISNESGTLAKNDLFVLRMILQNVRHGMARDISVSLDLPDNVILVEGDDNLQMGVLGGGEQKELRYVLVANNKFNGDAITLKVNLSEKTGSNAESRTITLPLGVSTASLNKGAESTVGAVASVPVSDVDKDIPVTGVEQKNTFALVIANENYRRVEKARYAANDGAVFGKYCTDVLGLSKDNVYIINDATYNDIKAGMNWIRQTAGAYGSDTQIIFYYAGHGIADEKTGDSYLLPSDGYANDVSTGYGVRQLYHELASCPGKTVKVFIDASFTGTQRNGKNISSARAVGIKPRKDAPANKMVVFSAARGSDKALSYDDKGHGLFTYYLLKKLKDSKGTVSLGELDSYLNTQVSQTSLSISDNIQRPVVDAADGMKDIWKFLKLR